MKKGIAIVFVCVSILLLISMPVVSAGWFNDFLGGVKNFFGDDAGITGNVIAGCTGNLTVNCSDYAYGTLGCNGQEPIVCGDVSTGGWNCGQGGDSECASCSLVLDCEDLNQTQCSGISGCSLGSDWNCSNGDVLNCTMQDGTTGQKTCVEGGWGVCTELENLVPCIDSLDGSYDCFFINQTYFTYFEDYDIVEDGVLNNSDIIMWDQVEREGILNKLDVIISSENFPPNHPNSLGGCTNNLAINFNPNANHYDESCIYNDVCSNGDVLDCTMQDGTTGQKTCVEGGWGVCTELENLVPCIDSLDGSYDCYFINQNYFTYFEDYDFVEDGVLNNSDIIMWSRTEREEILNKLYVIISSENFPPNHPNSFGGCTNNLATNFNPNANYYDGSCIYNDVGSPAQGSGDSPLISWKVVWMFFLFVLGFFVLIIILRKKFEEIHS